MPDVLFKGEPIPKMIYTLSKLVIEDPKNPANPKRAHLAIVLNELERVEREYEDKRAAWEDAAAPMLALTHDGEIVEVDEYPF